MKSATGVCVAASRKKNSSPDIENSRGGKRVPVFSSTAIGKEKIDETSPRVFFCRIKNVTHAAI